MFAIESLEDLLIVAFAIQQDESNPYYLRNRTSPLTIWLDYDGEEYVAGDLYDDEFQILTSLNGESLINIMKNPKYAKYLDEISSNVNDETEELETEIRVQTLDIDLTQVLTRFNNQDSLQSLNHNFTEKTKIEVCNFIVKVFSQAEQNQ